MKLRVKRPVKKRVVRKAAPAEGEEQQYGNIPPEKVRVKREKAARKGYEDKLATDPDHRPLKKKKAPIDDTELEENESVKPEVPDYSEEEQTSPKTSDPEVNEYDDEDDYDYEDEARFRPGRNLPRNPFAPWFWLLYLQRIRGRGRAVLAIILLPE